MGGGGSSSGMPKRFADGVYALDQKLIDRANAAGAAVDYGDATARQYDANVNEIRGMDLTDAKRRNAYSQLYNLTEAQLKAEANNRNPYAMGMGPARVNRREVQRNADKAVAARQAVNSFMDGLRREQAAQAEQRGRTTLTKAMTDALASGALSFTVNGKTYTRRNRRTRSFTLEG